MNEGEISFYLKDNIKDREQAWKIIKEVQNKISKVSGVKSVYSGGYNLKKELEG